MTLRREKKVNNIFPHARISAHNLCTNVNVPSSVFFVFFVRVSLRGARPSANWPYDGRTKERTNASMCNVFGAGSKGMRS